MFVLLGFVWAAGQEAGMTDVNTRTKVNIVGLS